MNNDIMIRLCKTTVILLFILTALLLCGCSAWGAERHAIRIVPLQNEWGILELDISSGDISLIYESSNEIFSSTLELNREGDTLFFAMKIDGKFDTDMEICSIGIDGQNLKRLTDNEFFDLYPDLSQDNSKIAFLSRRDKDLDIYMMDADGSNQRLFYDSGNHDADIDWVGDSIVFTSDFAIWKIHDDGSQPEQITDPENRGEWGNANLPVGDYDPRLSPDGKKIIFERLHDTSKPYGGYDLFVINSDGTAETRLTDTGYAQGLASWSHSGEEIVYSVAAIEGAGKYDIYLMNADGSENRNITPDYFPDNFLCYSPVFSADDSRILFIGRWWK